MADAGGVIPELAVPDPAAAVARLTGVFGFRPAGAGRLVRGSQVVAVRAGPAAAPGGAVDHVALAVPEVAAAAGAARAAGAEIDAEMTPQGPLRIAEFWGGGVEYLFLQGPGGARIELCCNLAAPVAAVGHDHIGLPCADLDASRAFWCGRGAQVIAEVALQRAEGVTRVAFLRLGPSVLELYQPPAPPPSRPGPGPWARLLIPGAVPARSPDGVEIAPA
jgi:catechol 2,3-dioxygenase-like lactoylglutathione lyase family enzyme